MSFHHDSLHMIDCCLCKSSQVLSLRFVYVWRSSSKWRTMLPSSRKFRLCHRSLSFVRSLPVRSMIPLLIVGSFSCAGGLWTELSYSPSIIRQRGHHAKYTSCHCTAISLLFLLNFFCLRQYNHNAENQLVCFFSSSQTIFP